jgi:hypothetical protein
MRLILLVAAPKRAFPNAYLSPHISMYVLWRKLNTETTDAPEAADVPVEADVLEDENTELLLTT